MRKRPSERKGREDNETKRTMETEGRRGEKQVVKGTKDSKTLLSGSFADPLPEQEEAKSHIFHFIL
jgi:hypothetical protein